MKIARLASDLFNHYALKIRNTGLNPMGIYNFTGFNIHYKGAEEHQQLETAFKKAGVDNASFTENETSCWVNFKLETAAQIWNFRRSLEQQKFQGGNFEIRKGITLGISKTRLPPPQP